MPRYTYHPTSVDAGSIGDLLLRRGQIAGNRARTVGDIQAQAAAARGQIWGNTIGSIGDIVSRGITGYAEQKAAAPAQQVDMAAKRANVEKTVAETAEITRKGDEAQRLTRQDTAFMGLLNMEGLTPEVLTSETLKIYGPSKGPTILQGFKALSDLQKGEIADARETAGRLALAMQQLSPALRTQAWPQIRQAAIQGGLGTEETIPPEPHADYLKAIVAWWKGEIPDDDLMNVPAGGAVFDPTTRQPVFENPREATPTNPTEASLAAAAAAGDPQATEALRLLREQGAAGQSRSGYHTITPIYDAQGRPVGAIQLDTRSGQRTILGPEDMGGGVTARPPGNLGQRTIENEAALDSLGRLKTMFDGGAKEDIGPAEGRARSAGQRVPGGAFVTERFANFEAATKAFQNAMIKAITGAQMSEPEATRIMGQIPNVNDNPTVWQAKYDQSVKNMEDLERRTRTDRGAPSDATDFDYDPATGQLVPRRAP